jgi:hypothetical protein
VGPPRLRVRRHWWWRPGWRPGRRQVAWHLTFGDQTVSRGQADLRRVVGGYQARLAGLPGLDPALVKWLHLTVQGIGFADEVGVGDVERIVAPVRRRCAAPAPVRLTVGPAELQEEGVWLRVAPAVAVQLGAIQLITLSRDEHLYRWKTLATVPLSLSARAGPKSTR